MNFYEIINQNYSKLSENDLLIWNYINEHPQKCISASIDQLALSCNFSKASIVRFAKKLGFSGFTELKIQLRMSMENSSQSPGTLTQMLCNIYIDSIERMKTENFDKLFNLMQQARRIYTYGSGHVQTSVCQELYRLFCNCGLYLCPLDNAINFEALSQNLNPRDIVILISTSGESQTIVKLAEFLKLRGIPIVSFTKLQQNTLASLSDINYFFQSPQFNIVSKSLYSTNLLFLICELLVLKYQDFLQSKKLSEI